MLSVKFFINFADSIFLYRYLSIASKTYSVKMLMGVTSLLSKATLLRSSGTLLMISHTAIKIKLVT